MPSRFDPMFDVDKRKENCDYSTLDYSPTSAAEQHACQGNLRTSAPYGSNGPTWPGVPPGSPDKAGVPTGYNISAEHPAYESQA